MITASEESTAPIAARSSETVIMGWIGGALRFGHVRFTALPIKMTPGSAIRASPHWLPDTERSIELREELVGEAPGRMGAMWPEIECAGKVQQG